MLEFSASQSISTLWKTKGVKNKTDKNHQTSCVWNCFMDELRPNEFGKAKKFLTITEIPGMSTSEGQSLWGSHRHPSLFQIRAERKQVKGGNHFLLFTKSSWKNRDQNLFGKLVLTHAADVAKTPTWHWNRRLALAHTCGIYPNRWSINHAATTVKHV